MLARVLWKKTPYLLPCLPIVFWTISSFPASMSYDSFVTWNQVKTNTYSDIHTAIFTAYVKILSINGSSMFVLAVFQSIICTLAIYALVNHFITRNLFKQSIITTCLMFLPQIGLMAITAWKDIPFALFICIGSILIYQKDPWRNYVGSVVFGLGLTFRREGILLGFLFLLCLSLTKLFKLNQVKQISANKILKLMVISMLVALFTNLAFPSLVNSTKDSSAKFISVSPFFQDMAFAIATDSTQVPIHVKQNISQVMGEDGLVGATNCGSIWGMMASESFSDEMAEANSKNVLRDWLSTVNSPAMGNLIKAHICRSASYIPFPFSLGPTNTWLWTNFGIDENSGYPLSQKVIISPMTNLAESMNDFVLDYIFKISWPGLIYSLVMMIFFLRKNHSALERFFILVLSCRQLILIAISSSQEFRYAFLLYIFGYVYILTFIAQILLCLKARYRQSVLQNFRHQKAR